MPVEKAVATKVMDASMEATANCSQGQASEQEGWIIAQPPIWAPPNMPIVCPWTKGAPATSNPHRRQAR
jgi:hypothetical protein